MKRKVRTQKAQLKINKAKRRAALFIFLTLLGAKSLFALSKSDFIPSSRPVFSLSASPFWTVDYDGKTSFSSVSFSACAAFTPLDADAAFTMKNDELHFSLGARYTPKLTDRLFFGVQSRFHRMSREFLFVERDFLIGTVLRYERKRFSFEGEVSYFYKHTEFTLKKVSLPSLYNHNLALSFSSSYKIEPSLLLSFSLSSYDEDSFFLFCSPIGSLSLQKEIGKLTVGMKVSVQYVDFFTLSGTFREAKIKPYVRLFF